MLIRNDFIKEKQIRKVDMIKVILWDLDATLLDFGQAEAYAIRKCFEIFDMGECTDSMLERYSAINKTYWERLEREEITKQELLPGRFREFFGKEGLNTENVEAFNHEYQLRLGDKAFFCENGYETVSALKGKVKQYAVTNGTLIAQERKLKNSGLDELLDGAFISDQMGVEKPGIAFFDQVFASIGNYQKDEIMIVGDSLTSDILGGNRAGICCCWYNPMHKENNLNLKVDYEITDLQQVMELLM